MSEKRAAAATTPRVASRLGFIGILAALSGCATQVLTPCGTDGALCGHLDRPIDPLGHVPGKISISFELYRHRDAASTPVGTIVATEGGPGFPTSGTSDSYRTLFEPLLRDHDLLLVDNRGTGNSTPIDCRGVQTMADPTVEAVGACGRQLGATAAFFGSGMAADDLAAVLDALGIAKIDLYGDSYGTFMAQSFAGRHPDRLRSLVLDSAYPVRGASPYFPNTPIAIRAALERVCATNRSCGGDPIERLQRLLQRVRVKPIRGRAPDSGGHLIDAAIDPTSLETILYNGTYDATNYQEFDPAVRAVLDRDDPAPLLRMVAENIARAKSGDPTGDPHLFSFGLFAAVSCTDYPQIYDMAAPIPQRHAERDAAIAAEMAQNPQLYAPFTMQEWRSMQLDYSTIDLCADWPAVSTRPYPPAQPVSPNAKFTAAPTLVLSGELDSTTPAADAAAAAALFANARQVLFANSFHVVALGDRDACASVIVRRFVAALDPGPTDCAGQIPPIRLVSQFPAYAGDVAPALPISGNTAPKQDLSVAAAAVLTAADALLRVEHIEGSSGVGLRGGTFDVQTVRAGTKMVLHELRWATDLAVSGSVIQDDATGAISGTLQLSSSGSRVGQLRVGWNSHGGLSRATLDGEIDGKSVDATMPAP